MALVILGLGNDLLGDDAIGLLAATGLEGRAGPSVAVRRSSQSGLYLLESLQGFEDAIIVDSVLGDHPGQVRELKAAEIRPTIVPSAHYAGLGEALALAKEAGLTVPRRIRIFAVEVGACQTIGAPPGPRVLSALPRLHSEVVRTMKEWGYA